LPINIDRLFKEITAMRLYCPDIFEQFKCTGSDCSDNCCKAGWDIEIDDKTLEFYRSLDSGLGRRLVSNIYEEDGCHYMGQDGGCPFMNEKGLCSVQLEYGEEHISEICREHPRFYEWFGNYKEAGVGLSCEEVCRLLADHPKPVIFTEREIDEEEDSLGYNTELFPYIKKLRDIFISILQNRGYSVLHRSGILLYAAQDVQDAVDCGDVGRLKHICGLLSVEGFLMEIISEAKPSEDRAKIYKRLAEFFIGLDYINTGLRDKFQEVYDGAEDIAAKEKQFDKLYGESCFELEHIAVYFIYRYLLKAARDSDVTVRVYAAITAAAVIRLLFINEFVRSGRIPSKEERCGLIKDFSKEIEYSPDNMERLYDEILSDGIDFKALECILF